MVRNLFKLWIHFQIIYTFLFHFLRLCSPIHFFNEFILILIILMMKIWYVLSIVQIVWLWIIIVIISLSTIYNIGVVIPKPILFILISDWIVLLFMRWWPIVNFARTIIIDRILLKSYTFLVVNQTSIGLSL